MTKGNLLAKMGLDADGAKGLLSILLRSRLGDLREQSLIRQGNGWFHISGMGHEAAAAVALSMEAGDYAFPYYRDRAFCLQRGLSDLELGLAFYAKRDSSSGGRQLTGHFSNRKLNIWSHPSPVGAHLLPACGAAWGMQMDGGNAVVYTSLGEASTRQGDFFEAVCFAKERKLPMVFVVHDNRIAISTSTEKTNPISLGVLNESEWTRVDGSDIAALAEAGRRAVASARRGEGPAFIWCDVERFSNHSSADDQRMYRAAADLESMMERDPIEIYKHALINAGIMEKDAVQALEDEIREEIRSAYRLASTYEDPLAVEAQLHLKGDPVVAPVLDLELGRSCKILEAVNKTFHAALQSQSDLVFFGQDIADPKGGVFNLTKGLSTKAPERAVNSPLAESTIMGVAVGLASYGKRPCFEIQFIDFIFPGWNQLVTNMATLRWRSFGAWKCPLVIYAPYGGYLPGGALWHSQAGEGSFARIPGISVVVPSTPEDAAGLFWTAMHGEDPTIILLPKHLMWAELPVAASPDAIPIGQARTVRSGNLLTLVTWGNCVELVEKTLDSMEIDAGVELIDLRSIAPWDESAIRESVSKTGRLLIVQEDNLTGSVAQVIVANLTASSHMLGHLKASPVIVSKGDVHIGFNPIYEYGVLPDEARVRAAIEQLLSDEASFDQGSPTPLPATYVSPAEMIDTMQFTKKITVPILGEGIRVARVVSLLKAAGDTVKADDPLCEVETDKAVFPIESDEDGVLKEWCIEEDAEVSVGQEIAVLELAKPIRSQGLPAGANLTEEPVAAPPKRSHQSPGLTPEALKQMQGIVPATIEINCRWESVRDARIASKAGSEGTLATTTMVAWAVAQAMKKHERFASIVRGEALSYDPDRTDLGVAVAKPGDVLDTAVIPRVNTLEWPDFVKAYSDALYQVRHDKTVSKNRVSLLISSMAAYKVRTAIPIVVPPSLATLFIGAPQILPDPKSKTGATMEVVALVLTFDHRWINGVGAASFLTDVRKGIERFSL